MSEVLLSAELVILKASTGSQACF